MAQYTLNDYLEKFLKLQQLPDFAIIFEPYHARTVRRSKKGSALVEAERPSVKDLLPGTATAADLLDRLYELAPLTHDWVTEKPTYIARIYDDMGEWVALHELLSDLRTRPETREAESHQQVRKLLGAAFAKCDRLAEPAIVNKLASEVIKARRWK